jgi:hypothetical protein
MKQQSVDTKRRGFLLAASAGSAAAVAVVAVQTTSKAPQPLKVAAVDLGKGYQETAHVRDYYDSARM